jgi:hypothetical protein
MDGKMLEPVSKVWCKSFNLSCVYKTLEIRLEK